MAKTKARPATLTKSLHKFLTLASDPAAQPGEALNAMAAARRLLERHGLAWGDVLVISEPQAAASPRKRAASPRRPSPDDPNLRHPKPPPPAPDLDLADSESIARFARHLLIWAPPLSLHQWEKAVIQGIAERPPWSGQLLPKEFKVLEDVARRIGCW